jgi:hypothetical protein
MNERERERERKRKSLLLYMLPKQEREKKKIFSKSFYPNFTQASMVSSRSYENQCWVVLSSSKKQPVGTGGVYMDPS